MTLKHAVDAADGSRRQALRRPRAARSAPGMQEYFRDVFDHLHAAASRTIESIRDMLTTAIQVNLA